MRAAGMVLILATSPLIAAERAEAPYPTVSPAWTLNLEQPVRWQRVHPMGGLVVATDLCLYGVDTDKGAVAWSRCGLDGGPLEASYDVLHGTTLFLVSTGRLRDRTLAVDALDGHVVFDSRAAGIANILHRTVLFQAGGLLVLGQEKGDPTLKLFLADLVTGKVRWTNDEVVAGASPGLKKLAGVLANLAQASGKMPDPASIPAPLEVGADAVVLASGSEILKISAETGKILWRVPNSAGSGTTGLFLPDARPDVLLVGTEVTGTGMSTNGATPVQTCFSAHRLADGTPLWPKPIKMKGPLNPPVLLAHGALLSSGGGADGGIKLVEYGTGRSVWGKNGKGIDSDGGIVDYARTDEGLVVTTGKDSVWTSKGLVYSMNLVDVGAGAVRFDKSLRAKGRLLWTEAVPKGVLYVTTHEVNVFDPRTGSSAMGKALASESLVTADAGTVLYAFTPADGGLWRVDKQEAKAVRLNTAAVHLQGNDLPRALEVTDDHVTLLGMQSVVGFDLKGAILFQAYLPAPRNPGWVRALAVAQSIRMGMAAAQAGMASAAFAQYASAQQDGTLGRAVGDELARGYGQVSQAAAGASASYAAVARQRFQASADGRDFQFMMVQAERGFGIAQVDKGTGQVRGLIPIGRDKDPAYSVDDVARRVYYQPDDRRILGYAF